VSEIVCLAVDPGNESSGVVTFVPDEHVTGGMQVRESRQVANQELRVLLKALPYSTLLLETPRARGMPTSNEEMETLLWIGRFVECAARRNIRWSLLWRSDVKMFLCGATAKVTDANITAALKDYFGGEAVAVGGVKCPACKGRQSVDGGRKPCPGCRSLGKVAGTRGPKKCPDCKGRGDLPVGRIPCTACAGSGYTHPPGPLAQVSAHGWAALGVAVTWLHSPTFVHRILPPGGNAAAAAARRAVQAK
jgi:hypothetical protein